MSAKIYKILQGSFVDSDGTTKGYGEEIVIADDQASRFVGQIEYVRDLPVEAPADSSDVAGRILLPTDGSSTAGPADAASE